MKAKKLLIAALMLFAPAIGFGQGKGNGKGNGNGNKHGHNKAAKVKAKDNDNRAWQGKDRNVVVIDNDRRVRTTRRTQGGPPPWAPAHGYRAKQHAYFPDYYTFYDANRRGYVYWNNDSWLFSKSLPSFLSGVNLGTARFQPLNDIPLSAAPQTYYSRYSSAYPARQVNIIDLYLAKNSI
ncbi:MAG: hypothetical protein EOP56_01560 [Sphingobacteriales bacterium]|nr:MAG: hypothetical protein EOP56_01560 [Sphingobacteriales bacterium]